jgi:hypothetical protein
VARYRRSGLTQQAFAAAHGLALPRLRYWLYGRASRSTQPGEVPRFQELRVTPTPTAAAWAAEWTWPDGRTLRVGAELARELVPAWLAGS